MTHSHWKCMTSVPDAELGRHTGQSVSPRPSGFVHGNNWRLSKTKGVKKAWLPCLARKLPTRGSALRYCAVGFPIRPEFRATVGVEVIQPERTFGARTSQVPFSVCRTRASPRKCSSRPRLIPRRLSRLSDSRPVRWPHEAFATHAQVGSKGSCNSPRRPRARPRGAVETRGCGTAGFAQAGPDIGMPVQGSRKSSSSIANMRPPKAARQGSMSVRHRRAGCAGRDRATIRTRCSLRQGLTRRWRSFMRSTDRCS